MELLIASVATIAWSFADSTFARQLLQNIVVMSSLSTIVFNLNPLMKFDGYFVLSDGLQIPNLSAEASGELHRLGRRLFFGDVSSAPRIAGGRRWIVLGYGMSAAMWRLVMSVSLLLAASILAHGAGLILAAVGLVMWFGKPAAQFTKMIWAMRLESPERLIRAVLVFSSLLLATTAAAAWLPAPVLTVAPGIIEYVDAEMIRAETEGFVSQVHVNDGDIVQPGSVLVTLRNDDIQSELTSARKRLDQETLRMKSAASTHDAPAVSIAVGNLESLRKQVRECQRRVDGLSLRATRNGHVSARTLHQLPGTWLQTGTLVAIVGDPSRKEVRASVGQRELSRSLSLIGEPVRVRAGDQPAVSGTLVRVDPQGSRDLAEQSLAATNGGPLEVEEATERDGEQQEQKMRLTEHRFQAVVSLDPSVAQQFYCGQRGQVTLGAAEITLGRFVWRATNQWFREKLNVTDTSR